MLAASLFSCRPAHPTAFPGKGQRSPSLEPDLAQVRAAKLIIELSIPTALTKEKQEKQKKKVINRPIGLY